MIIEIALILIWVSWFVYTLINLKLKKLRYLLISSVIVGTLFIWLDNYVGEIRYITTINIPDTNYPMSIITLASLYFVSIISLRNLIMHKWLKSVKNRIVFAVLGFMVTAVLNVLYPVVDFIIVNMDGGVFTNDHINQFYTSFEHHPDIQQYQLYAYVFFLLAIYASQWIAFLGYELIGFVRQCCK